MQCEIGLLMDKLHRHNTKPEISQHRSLRHAQDLCSQVRPKTRHLHQEMTMMSSWAHHLLHRTKGTLTC